MFRKNAKETADMTAQLIVLKKRFKKLAKPAEAVQLLQDTLDVSHFLDKHLLQDFILDLRQIATDLQFKHYRARCRYILIPPEDALTFWITLRLGNCPEESRLADFEGEILELLKLLSTADPPDQKAGYLPRKEVETALRLIKTKYPGFLTGLTSEPILIPVLNFHMQSEALLSRPALHAFVLIGSKAEEQEILITVLHALAHLINYRLTDDLEIMPPGFANLLQKACLEPEGTAMTGWEAFAELMTASLLYETEFMSFVAYLELNQEQQQEIHRYFCWLQGMYFFNLGNNIKKLMEEHQKKLRA